MKRIFYFLLLFSNISTAQVNLELGLRAYYPFSGNANDASSFHNDPVFNNAKLTKDRFGNPNSAYHFNGRNSYMRILNDASLNMKTTMSIALWVKADDYYRGRCYNNMLVMKGDIDYKRGNYFVRFSDAYTGCTDPTTKTERFYGQAVVAPNPLVQLDQWYSVVWTSDGSTTKIYVNCQLMQSAPLGAFTFSNRDDLFFGRMNDSQYPYWLSGDLDEIRIYDRALSLDEVRVLCDRKQDPAPLIATTKKAEPTAPKKEVVAKKKDKKKVEETRPANTELVNDEIVNPLNAKDLKTIEAGEQVKLEQRSNETIREIIVDQDSITVTLYDNAEIDGDSITLIYNDKILATHQLLTDKPLTFIIKIAPGNNPNKLLMYAENLGSIPPNTALMVIYDGNKRYEVNVRSSKTSNGAVSFKLKE